MQAAQPSALEMFLPFIFIFVIFYFLIIRPQSKRLKSHETFLKEIKKGDQVVTSSGIIGSIDGITDQFVTLEIAQGVKIKVLKKQIASSAQSVLNSEKK